MKRLWKALYLAGVLAEIALRMPYARERRQLSVADSRVSRMERGRVGLIFFGMLLIPLVYICTRWLDRADYRWSPETGTRAGGLGSILLGAALWLFWRSHADLGRNWSPSLEIADQHTLVTQGVYQSIRHPMYASQWLWSVAQILLLQNWVAGPASLVLFLPVYLGRVPQEEQMMLDHFGDAYRAYMARTGRVIPWIKG
jgi:protein-S-isoprenylcysteine O-methyltransferase Ste14